MQVKKSKIPSGRFQFITFKTRRCECLISINHRRLPLMQKKYSYLFLQNLPHESINLKNHESLPTSPTSVPRDESKESIINLPLIPFKLKPEAHPRTKLNDGEYSARQKSKSAAMTNCVFTLGTLLGYSARDDQTQHEAASSPLDIDLKDMERSFELEI